MPLVRLISLDRCRRGGGTFVEHGGRELAVFRTSDPERVFVTDNACPHAGGNLSGGDLEGDMVTCPWHHWKFDLASGTCPHSTLARVGTYAVEVRDGTVWAHLPAVG